MIYALGALYTMKGATMPHDGVLPEEKAKIRRLVHAIIPDVTVYLYGSRAKGTSTIASDIDLAIDAKTKLNPRIPAEIKSVLEGSFLLYAFDIVDLNAVSADFRETIKKEAVLWK